MKALNIFVLLAAVVATISASPLQAQLRLSDKRAAKTQKNQTQKNSRQPSKNRLGGGTLTPTGGLPDLAITELKQSGSLILVTVKNIGEQPASPSKVRVSVARRSNGARLASKELHLKQLGMRQSTTLIFDGLPLSDVRVLAFADPSTKIREKTERNNTRRFTIGDQSQRVPDLAVRRITRNRNGLTVVVANKGKSNAPVSQMLVVVRRRSDLSTILRKTVSVAGIGPRGEAVIRVAAPEISNTDVFATADHSRRVRESHEGNNTQHATFGP